MVRMAELISGFTQRSAVGPAAIVQCKHWKNRVGVELQEFFGVMAI
jgi:hypothetical protein